MGGFKQFMTALAVLIILSGTAGAFVSEGGINRYLAYEDMEVKTPFVHRVKDPLIRGYFVNRTQSRMQATVKLSFYNIFHEQLEAVTLQADIPPAGRSEFRRYVSNRENIERLVRAYRIEWEVLNMKLDGKSIVSGK